VSRSHIFAICVALLAPAAPCAGDEPTFRSLFNGKDLTGWDGEAGLWRVEDGVIEGGHTDAGESLAGASGLSSGAARAARQTQNLPGGSRRLG